MESTTCIGTASKAKTVLVLRNRIIGLMKSTYSSGALVLTTLFQRKISRLVSR